MLPSRGKRRYGDDGRKPVFGWFRWRRGEGQVKHLHGNRPSYSVRRRL